MMSVISFIVESLICSGLFLVLYRWMLAKKVGFRICRFDRADGSGRGTADISARVYG